MSLAELAINRVAVPMLRPLRGDPPPWHTALDYLGLFLFYFASLLAVVVCGLRVAQAFERRDGTRLRAVASVAPLMALAGCGAWAVLLSAGQPLTLALELGLLGATVVAAARGASWRWDSDRDGGVALAVVLLAAPILVHSAAVLGARWLWGEEAVDGIGGFPRSVAIALVIAGLLSPYCLAPRPFVRAVTRLPPVIAAIAIALGGAWLLREGYFATAHALRLAIGFELDTSRHDPCLTLYLLATATMTWTITSCALAARPQRQAVAVALGLLIAGGSAYAWPQNYLLLALGLTLLADLAVPVRLAEAELVGRDPAHAIAVDDLAWGRFVAAATSALRQRFTSLHALTTRGTDYSTSTVLIGEVHDLTVRLRVDREGGVVIGLDIALGRDLEAVPQSATLTVVSDDERLLADAPAAGELLGRDDDAFGRRFICRGDAAALRQLFDDELRARAATALDGWVAYVVGRSLRYRHYPTRSSAVAPVLPLAKLARGQLPADAGERLLVVVDLLLAVSERAGLCRRAQAADAASPSDAASPPMEGTT